MEGMGAGCTVQVGVITIQPQEILAVTTVDITVDITEAITEAAGMEEALEEGMAEVAEAGEEIVEAAVEVGVDVRFGDKTTLGDARYRP
jgi:hypothetical protein